MPVHTSSESHPHPDLNPRGLQCQGVLGPLDCAHCRLHTPLPRAPARCLSVRCGPTSSGMSQELAGREDPPCAPGPSETQGRALAQETLRPAQVGELPAQ